MAAKPSRDITFSTDDQACRTLVIDMSNDPPGKHQTIDDDATVVLDLTPVQVNDMLTQANTTKRRG
jgi:hypothetical protein